MVIVNELLVRPALMILAMGAPKNKTIKKVTSISEWETFGMQLFLEFHSLYKGEHSIEHLKDCQERPVLERAFDKRKIYWFPWVILPFPSNLLYKISIVKHAIFIIGNTFQWKKVFKRGVRLERLGGSSVDHQKRTKYTLFRRMVTPWWMIQKRKLARRGV